MSHDNVNDKVSGDLVSRAEAIELVRSMTISLGGKEIFHPEAKKSVLCALDELPAVDAAPVVHGRWIPEYEEMEVLVGVYGYTQVKNVLTGWRCSVCDRCEGLPREEMPYCHCGAKMDL